MEATLTRLCARILAALGLPWLARPGLDCRKCGQTITWHDFFHVPVYLWIDMTGPIPRRVAMEHEHCPPPRGKKARRPVPKPSFA